MQRWEFPAIQISLADCDFFLVCREMTAPLRAWQEPTEPIVHRFVIAKMMVHVPLWMVCAIAKKVNKIQI